MAGTPAFMSPEQALGNGIDSRTDIFSLGMTLYYMLTGAVGHEAPGRQNQAEAFDKQTPSPPSSLRSEVSGDLDAIVMRMIAVKPSERYQSTPEAATDLRGALAEISGSAETEPTRGNPKWTRKRLHAAAAVILSSLVIAGLSLAYLAYPGKEPGRSLAGSRGELFPRVGFIVTNLGGGAAGVVWFYNGRGTAEQWIKEGKNAVRWTRLSCHDFVDNQARLQLFALAYNLGNLLRRLALPGSVKHWSLTTLQEKLIKIGAKVEAHSRYVFFQMAEVVVPKRLFRAILQRIRRLRRPETAPR